MRGKKTPRQVGHSPHRFVLLARLKLFFEEAAAEFQFRPVLDITELSRMKPKKWSGIGRLSVSAAGYLIVAPHNTDAMRAKLQEVMDREIPLLTIDTTIDDNPSPCHIGTNPEDDGRIMAGLFHFAFAEHTPRLLTLYRYQFHLASTYRKRAFFDELDHLGQTYEVVEDAVITGLPESSYHKPGSCSAASWMPSLSPPATPRAFVMPDRCGRTGTLKVYAYDITGNLRRYLDEGVVTATSPVQPPDRRGSHEDVADEIIFGRQNNESFIVTPSSSCVNHPINPITKGHLCLSSYFAHSRPAGQLHRLHQRHGGGIIKPVWI